MIAERAAERFPLLVKLQRYLKPTGADLDALRLLGAQRQWGRAGQRLGEEGADLPAAYLLHEGWAIRHRNLADGRRQIIDFLLPGDFSDPSAFVTRHADSAITAITPVSYSMINARALLDAVTRSPRLGVYLWWIEAQEAALLRRHLFAVGRMNARERIAQLILELWTRLSLVVPKPPRAFHIPAAQEMIADATGLSIVHVSRTLSLLQKEGVIHRKGHNYQIIDLPALRRIAQAGSRSWPEALPEEVRAALGQLQA